MAKKSKRSKAQMKAGKIEDLPARQKGKSIKGGGGFDLYVTKDRGDNWTR